VGRLCPSLIPKALSLAPPIALRRSSHAGCDEVRIPINDTSSSVYSLYDEALLAENAYRRSQARRVAGNATLFHNGLNRNSDISAFSIATNFGVV
jgi:hypothetical protein